MPTAPRNAPRRAPAARQSIHPQAAVATCAAPLLQLQAHWTIQAHPRYLEAAAFLWQR